MKAKDVAFMVDLISANYRRRMLYFWINIIVMVVPIPLIIINSYFGPNPLELSTAFNYFLVSCIFGGLIRFIITYVIVPIDESNAPWDIKDRQMKALKQVVKAKAEFEELEYCVPLHEYFGR